MIRNLFEFLLSDEVEKYAPKVRMISIILLQYILLVSCNLYL